MIKVHRLKSKIDNDIEYTIFINDVSMRTIKEGEIIDFQLRLADSYKIHIKGGEFVSNSISFDIHEGEIIEFVCEPRYKNTFFSKFLYHTILKKEGIRLDIQQDFYL